MAKDSVVLRFEKVTFEYQHKKPLLEEVSFAIRGGAKLTLMGQNGAGKSSLFKLIMGELKPQSGRVSLDREATVAIGRQTIPREQLEYTVEEFFGQFFSEKQWNLPKLIAGVLNAVNLPMPSLEKKMREFSGGQQARLLLASALIQNPDILLLDEPTNNLDYEGIAHLTQFLIEYEKTVLVISHDADFLNAFTEGVLYLDVHTHTLEQYAGDYYDVVEGASQNKVTILNRWGDVVWNTNDYNNTDKVFIGETNDGKELPSGTYFYKVELSSGKLYTGFITLKR